MKKITTILLLYTLVSLNPVNAQMGWYELSSPGDDNLNRVYFLNQDSGFIIDNAGRIFNTTDGGDSWGEVSSGTTNSLYGIHFTNPTTGYIVGYGSTVLKSEDRGLTWEPSNSGIGAGMKLFDIHFLGDSLGYIAGYSSEGLRSIFKTADAGNTWSELVGDIPDYEYLPNFYHKSIYVNSDSTVYIASDTSAYGYPHNSLDFASSSYIFKIDKNDKWEVAIELDTYYNIYGTLNDIYFKNDTSGYMCGTRLRSDFTTYELYQFKIDGDNFNPDTIDTRMEFNRRDYLLNLDFFNNQKGVAVGGYVDSGTEANGLIMITNDGGITWEEQQIPSATTLVSAQYLSENEIIVVGGTRIYKTDNAGINLQVDLPDSLSLYCNQTDSLKPAISYNGNNELIYSWEPAIGLSDPNVASPVIIPTTDITYTLTVSDGTIEVSDSIRIELKSRPAPEICIVTVDATNNKNELLFNTSSIENADSIRIFKETSTTDVFELIATIPAYETDTYIDSESNPDQKSARYQISMIDSCGLETELSEIHKTMHLTVNKGQAGVINLIWDQYEGFPVQKYKIWRGINEVNLKLIDEVAANNFTYTDLSAPVGYKVYVIEVEKEGSCSESTLKSTSKVVSSKSNLGIIEEETSIVEDLSEIKIFPNPVKDLLFLEGEVMTNSDISLYDLTGKELHVNISKDNKMIDFSGLESGYYLVKITSDNYDITYRILKE